MQLNEEDDDLYEEPVVAKTQPDQASDGKAAAAEEAKAAEEVKAPKKDEPPYIVNGTNCDV